MRKSVAGSLIVIILVCLLVVCAYGSSDFPRPVGAVNDFAGIISQRYAQSMESLSREVLSKTGTSVIIVTMKDIGGDEPGDYANRLYEAWGIGKKDEDKGVLIFLAVKERRIRIETGYGVEGILPDGLVGDMLDQYVVPWLRKGDYSNGLSSAVVAVSSIIARDAGVTLTGAPQTHQHPASKENKGSSVFSLIMLLVVISLLLGTRQGRRMLPFILLMLLMGGRGGGGSGGGFGGGFGGFGGGMSGGGGAGRGF
ncbi:MAG: TPM domain-containing protein [Thermodesulfobacteriota bacterium]|nr:TPM domain-containing protein [Thermodesulfobacteriota bacterium]